VLVVEAGLASGSLHTARFAADAGVPVYAVPGPYPSPRSRGCHALIADGAGVAMDPEWLLRELGVAAALPATAGGEVGVELRESADAAAILRVLQQGPRPADLVRRESRLENGPFLRALFALLDAGRVVQLGGDVLAPLTARRPR
jgi:DNA processing protein